MCEAYQGGSTLCDSRVGEGVYIYFKNARGISTQAELTLRLNDIISPVLAVVSTHCQELIQNVLCLYYYTPCGVNGTLTSLVSICSEECFYVQNECAGTWNQLASLLGISGSGLGFINCSSPGQILDPLPHCCVDAGVTVPGENSCKLHNYLQCLFLLFTVFMFKILNYIIIHSFSKYIYFYSAYKCICCERISGCNRHQPILSLPITNYFNKFSPCHCP